MVSFIWIQVDLSIKYGFIYMDTSRGIYINMDLFIWIQEESPLMWFTTTQIKNIQFKTVFLEWYSLIFLQSNSFLTNADPFTLNHRIPSTILSNPPPFILPFPFTRLQTSTITSNFPCLLFHETLFFLLTPFVFNSAMIVPFHFSLLKCIAFSLNFKFLYYSPLMPSSLTCFVCSLSPFVVSLNGL